MEDKEKKNEELTRRTLIFRKTIRHGYIVRATSNEDALEQIKHLEPSWTEEICEELEYVYPLEQEHTKTDESPKDGI